MKYILAIILTASLFSCKTTKFVEKEKIVVDSTAIKERDAVKRVLKEAIEQFEKEKEQWESTGIIFETTPCPDSTKTQPTKIVFDNGKLKSIEGNVRSLTSDLYEKSVELYDAHSVIDSLSEETERLQTALSKTETKVVKEIKRVAFIPWWIWVIAGLAVVFGSHPYAKKFLKSKNILWQKT